MDRNAGAPLPAGHSEDRPLTERAVSQAGGPGEDVRILMTTAVWGVWHLMAHLTCNLPTLLAAGNLPLLAERFPIRYLTFTRKEDYEKIRSSPAMQRLKDLKVELEFEFLSPDILSDPIAAHHHAWNEATRRARERREFLLLMPPDVAWAGNSFGVIADRLAEGHRAVFMTYLRAESESFLDALKKLQEPDRIDLAVSQEKMVELCTASLHPLMAASFRDSDFFPIHPEMILWPVPDEGFAVRVLAREMFLFDPTYFNLNSAALPDSRLSEDEVSFLCDSDDLFAVSLAEIGKDVQWHILPRKADALTIAPWWLRYDSKSNDFMVGQKIRWHFKPVTEAKWRAVEAGADLLVHRLIAAREALRVWQVAQVQDCQTAATLLALLLHTGAIAGLMRSREAALVFLPTDQAFAGLESDLIDNDADEGAVRRLVRHARWHVCPVAHSVVEAADPLLAAQTAAGSSQVRTGEGALPFTCNADGVWQVGDATIASDPIRTGPLAIYLVESFVRSG